MRLIQSPNLQEVPRSVRICSAGVCGLEEADVLLLEIYSGRGDSKRVNTRTQAQQQNTTVNS